MSDNSVNSDDKDDKSDDIKVNSISDDNKISRHNISLPGDDLHLCC